MLKIELTEKIARLIAKNEGSFMFAPDLLLTQSSHPQIRRWVATSLEVLELLADFLEANELTFDDLEIKEDANKLALSTAPKINKPASEIVRIKIPTWEEINEWVEQLYLCWGVFRRERMTFEQYELDKVAALEDQFTHAQLQAIHHAVSQTSDSAIFAPQRDKSKLAGAIVQMLNPYPKALEINLYFKADPETKEYICVGGEASDYWAATHKGDFTVSEKFMLPLTFNPYNRTLAEVRKECQNFNNLLVNTETEQVEKTSKQGQVALGHKNLLINTVIERTPELQVKVDDKANLYFDSNDICLGFWASWQTELPYYRGMYAYSVVASLPVDPKVDPRGRSVQEFLTEKEIKTIRAKSTNHTNYSELTKAEKNSMIYFVGREIEFERFLTIKKELAAIGIKVGNLISSQPNIKAWYVTGGVKGRDKAALYYTAWDGFEVGCREGQDELTGVFEDWSVIQHLDDNDIEVNGIAAGHWHNARCEKAEAEAVALQTQEAKPKTKKASAVKSQKTDRNWAEVYNPTLD